jgi:hypothetical protein
MARVPTDPHPIADLHLYLQGVAKYLVDRLYGPDGPARGTSLASLEKAVEAVRLALAEQILKQALSRQARAYSSDPPDSVCCPGCHRPPRPRPPEPRVVRTDVGTAEWLEPHYFCPKCRKAFFPSVGRPRP